MPIQLHNREIPVSDHDLSPHFPTRRTCDVGDMGYDRASLDSTVPVILTAPPPLPLCAAGGGMSAAEARAARGGVSGQVHHIGRRRGALRGGPARAVRIARGGLVRQHAASRRRRGGCVTVARGAARRRRRGRESLRCRQADRRRGGVRRRRGVPLSVLGDDGWLVHADADVRTGQRGADATVDLRRGADAPFFVQHCGSTDHRAAHDGGWHGLSVYSGAPRIHPLQSPLLSSGGADVVSRERGEVGGESVSNR